MENKNMKDYRKTIKVFQDVVEHNECWLDSHQEEVQNAFRDLNKLVKAFESAYTEVEEKQEESIQKKALHKLVKFIDDAIQQWEFSQFGYFKDKEEYYDCVNLLEEFIDKGENNE